MRPPTRLILPLSIKGETVALGVQNAAINQVAATVQKAIGYRDEFVTDPPGDDGVSTDKNVSLAVFRVVLDAARSLKPGCAGITPSISSELTHPDRATVLPSLR